MQEQDTTAYSTPQIRSLGSVEQMTEQNGSNKVGTSADAFTALTSGAIVGKVVPPQQP